MNKMTPLPPKKNVLVVAHAVNVVAATAANANKWIQIRAALKQLRSLRSLRKRLLISNPRQKLQQLSAALKKPAQHLLLTMQQAAPQQLLQPAAHKSQKCSQPWLKMPPPDAALLKLSTLRKQHRLQSNNLYCKFRSQLQQL